ncbi:12763_t:CDS:2 [Cetraspora pellucida]|uniref:12763_t:CDS:1 n=1 Tax=Cetraspora pellucida TaxID=1433469 RepID=A0ACA9JVZ8_9GLOM|nr:12763_t:CDS:2 [Cetraspora pellucida]
MYYFIYQFGILENVFLASKVLLLRLKKFSELNNLSTNTTVTVEVTVL